MYRKALLVTVLLTAACAQPTETTAPVDPLTITNVEVLHGKTPNDFALSWAVDQADADDCMVSIRCNGARRFRHSGGCHGEMPCVRHSLVCLCRSFNPWSLSGSCCK